MDVTCVCGEPWDSYHMQHDEIWETDLPESIKKHVSKEGTKLNFPGVREAFARNGWKFAGNSVLAILRCPCCPKSEDSDNPNAKTRTDARRVLADLLGDDEDGLASMLEDADMMEGFD